MDPHSTKLMGQQAITKGKSNKFEEKSRNWTLVVTFLFENNGHVKGHMERILLRTGTERTSGTNTAHFNKSNTQDAVVVIPHPANYNVDTGLFLTS